MNKKISLTIILLIILTAIYFRMNFLKNSTVPVKNIINSEKISEKDIESQKNIIQDSDELIEETKNLETEEDEIDRMIDELEELDL